MAKDGAFRPNPIERAIAWISPRTALRRFHDRTALTRAYEAAAPGDPWRPRRSGASANADHLADAGRMRGKARSLRQNVPYIEFGMSNLVSYTIGTGITHTFTGPNAVKLNELFKEWCKVADADGNLDYYGLQAAAYDAMEQDGEVLVRLRPRLSTDGLPVPLQLQLLEIDWLDSSKTGVINGQAVVNGIQYDLLGKKVAYWLFDQHPGDVTIAPGARAVSRPVPASSIIHLFTPKRPGQGRGFTRLAPVINRSRDLHLYEDAEIARKNNESRLAVLASGDVSQMATPMTPSAAADPNEAKRTGDLGELRSGGIMQLPGGMNLTTIAPEAAPGYVDYVKLQLHLIAAGMGVPYELLTGDLSEVNFSSMRGGRQGFKRNVERVQWHIVIPMLCERVCQAFVNAADLAGKVSNTRYGVVHAVPRWEHVNPSEDVAAELSEIGGGLSSISAKLRSRGEDPAAVFAELHKDLEDLDRLKVGDHSVLEVLLLLQKGKGPVATAPAAPAASAAPAPAKAAK
jgi:lambda family phage portal protein